MNILYIRSENEKPLSSIMMIDGINVIVANSIYNAMLDLVVTDIDCVIMDKKTYGSYTNIGKFIQTLEEMEIPLAEYNEIRNSPLKRDIHAYNKSCVNILNIIKEPFLKWRKLIGPIEV